MKVRPLLLITLVFAGSPSKSPAEEPDPVAEEARRRVVEGMNSTAPQSSTAPKYQTRGMKRSATAQAAEPKAPQAENRRGYRSRGPRPTLEDPEAARAKIGSVSAMRPNDVPGMAREEFRVDSEHKIDFSDILFVKGKAEFAEGRTMARVSGMAAGIRDLIKAHPSQRYLIEGHTCDLGAEDFNASLSWLRAEVVRLTLIGLGVPAANLRALGFGEDEAQSLSSLPPELDAPRQPYRKVAIRAILPD